MPLFSEDSAQLGQRRTDLLEYGALEEITPFCPKIFGETTGLIELLAANVILLVAGFFKSRNSLIAFF